MKKKDMKKVMAAFRMVADVRLERIRELIRQRNQFQQEVITLQQQLTEAQSNRDERLDRWRQRVVELKRQILEAKAAHQRDVGDLSAQLAAQPWKARAICDVKMADEDSGDTDPHWCDKTLDHGDIDGPSPHRCGDCKQEWVVD